MVLNICNFIQRTEQVPIELDISAIEDYYYYWRQRVKTSDLNNDKFSGNTKNLFKIQSFIFYIQPFTTNIMYRLKINKPA